MKADCEAGDLVYLLELHVGHSVPGLHFNSLDCPKTSIGKELLSSLDEETEPQSDYTFASRPRK